VRRQARREQQLQPEGELVGRAAAGRIGVQQRELVGEQVVGGRVGVALLEQARDGVARPRRRVEGAAVGAQARVGGAGLRAGHGEHVAAALVEHEVQTEERLEPAPEAAARLARPLGDRRQPAAAGRVEVQHAVTLAVADRAQHDRLGLERAGHQGRRRSGCGLADRMDPLALHALRTRSPP
jgi:hypothetical protein